MSLLADMIAREFEGLMIEGESVLRNLQCDNVYDIDKLIAWRKKAGAFLTAWETFPSLAKIECCPTPERTFKDRLELQVELVAEVFNIVTHQNSAKSEPVETNEPVKNIPMGEETFKVFNDWIVGGIGNAMKAGDPIDKILEERGKVHGDSNWSGAFFNEGIELLRDVGEKSDIPRHSAFDGHMYAGMQCFIRLMHNPYHRDSYDDLLGYLRLAMKAIDNKEV